MRLVYEDVNVVAHIDETKTLLEYKWTINTDNSTSEELLESFNSVMAKVLELKPKKVLSNNFDFKGVIDVELQEKIVQAIYKTMHAAGCEKIAYLFPKEIIAELSFSQAKEETEKFSAIKKFESKFYDSSEEAKAWLLED